MVVTKKMGLFGRLYSTSSLIGIFIHGIYMLICLSVGMVTEQGFVLPYTVSWLLSVCFTYLICMKSKGFNQG
ncbi:hypothetical protein ACT691_06940 [Vibrio metschnikovii]